MSRKPLPRHPVTQPQNASYRFIPLTRAYDEAAIRIHGEFAHLNFPVAL
jgi:hypothetical protein